MNTKLRASQINKHTVELLTDLSTMEGFCDKLCFSFMGDMGHYLGILLKNARAANYEEKFGKESMKNLLMQGLAQRMKSLGECNLQIHANKDEIDIILSQDLDLELA